MLETSIDKLAAAMERLATAIEGQTGAYWLNLPKSTTIRPSVLASRPTFSSARLKENR